LSHAVAGFSSDAAGAPTMPKDRSHENAPKEPEKKAEDEALDDQLEDTFPASDPPSTTRPGHGITGAEVKRNDADK
jgi:hypothetical protein